MRAKNLEATLSGVESYSFLPRELRAIDSKTYKYLRAMEQGKATEWLEGGKGKSIGMMTLFRRWRFLPATGELAIRRVKWLQQIVLHPGPARQVRAAVWGHLPGEQPTISPTGAINPEANPFAKHFVAGLWFFYSTSSAEEFFWRMGFF